MLFEILLVLVQHAVEPGEQLLCTVIRVENNGNAIGGCNGTHVEGASNGTGDGAFLLLVCDALPGEVGSPSIGELEDDRRLCVSGRLECCDDCGRRGHVEGRNGKSFLLAMLEKLLHIVAAAERSCQYLILANEGRPTQ